MKKTGNPQILVRAPKKLLTVMIKKAKAAGVSVPRWLLTLGALECGYTDELPVYCRKTKGKK